MKYARYLPKEKRRETWEEIVARNKQMHIKKYPSLAKEIDDNFQLVLDKKILPSMRSLQFAGKPIEISPNRIYNCCYLPIDDVHAFSESMFLLLGGTGVGYSVQKHHIEKLPMLRGVIKAKRKKRFLIGDSIEGWADAIKALLNSYFRGSKEVEFDYRDVRPKGAKLITSGGKAPGPEPLRECIEKIRVLLEKAISERGVNTKLRSIEAHDIMCYIADAVLAGGIRRAAMICLFSFDDEDMLGCKGNFPIAAWGHRFDTRRDENGEPVQTIQIHEDVDGKKYYDLNVELNDPAYGKKDTQAWWVSEDDLARLKEKGVLPWYCFHPHRGRSNNSAVAVRHRIQKSDFLKLWAQIEASGAGEPGIYFTNDKEWGTNPCVEIGLRPFQFCNLVTINGSDVENQEDLNKRARSASFLGTLQAGYTDFHYLRDIWRETTEKEALIGVSITGIGSGKILNFDLKEAAEIVKAENERVAKLIGINIAARTTCVKPEGTSSLVLGTSSGIHAWHNPYYLRRIRVGKNEAIYKYLSVMHPELLEDDRFRPEIQAVITVPVKAPSGSIFRNETAINLLERMKKVSTEWVRAGHRSGSNSHNVSVTVSVKDNEWKSVGEWMWDNKDFYNGIAVLPYDGGTYIQAPFEDCTEEEYERRLEHLTKVDLKYVIEEDDDTNLSGEIACAGGNCNVS